jgi:transcription initiation factor TFIIIB Brf1 subunit/transcription initiation factor TFIIB
LRREDPFLTCDEEVHAVVYDPERAEAVCSKCGLVFDNARIDFLTELHAVPAIICRSRAKKAPQRLLKDQSLERSLRTEFSDKGVPKLVQDKALELCQLVQKERFRTGYPVSTLSNALIYAAYRLCRVPATLAECAASLTKERRNVARCYGKLSRQLKLNVPRFETIDYLSFLAENEEVKDDAVLLASRILKRIRERGVGKGANPVGIAAAALYEAGNLTGNGITQKKLAIIAGVSEATVRVNCKMIRAILDMSALY